MQWFILYRKKGNKKIATYGRWEKNKVKHAILFTKLIIILEKKQGNNCEGKEWTEPQREAHSRG